MPKPIEPIWSWLPGEKETLDERYRDGFMIVDYESQQLRIINAKEMNEFCHMDYEEKKTNEDR